MKLDAPCPCGGLGDATTYGQCCAPFILDGAAPPTCEQLMRSRYTAFVVEDANHLWRTWHPSTRPASVGELSGGEWRGLDVLATEAGGLDDSEGMVEFVARFHGAGGAGRLHERSRFTRRAGRWFYVDGDDLG